MCDLCFEDYEYNVVRCEVAKNRDIKLAHCNGCSTDMHDELREKY